MTARNPIYKDLLRLGRDERQLDQDALCRYPRILQAPAVVSRTGEARSLHPEAYAEQLIRDTVAGILAPRERAVGEAALCLNASYIGLKIGVRQERLAGSPEYVTTDMFKYYRKKVLARITLRLETPDPAEVDRLLRGDRMKCYEADRGRWTLAGASAHLQYAALSALFVADCTRLLGLPSEYRPAAPRLGASELCSFQTFLQFLQFIKVALPMARSYDREAGPHSPDEQKLWDRVDALLAYGPQFTEPERRIIVRVLGDAVDPGSDEVWELYRARWQPKFTDITDRVTKRHQTPTDDQTTVEAIVSQYQVVITIVPTDYGVRITHRTQMPAVKPLTELARQASQVTTIALSLNRATRPVVANARAFGHQLLNYFFDFDAFAPLLDGESLRNRADAFFDQLIAVFANAA